MADDFNPYSAPQTSTQAPVVEEGSGLKSLGQEVRKASINKARWCLIAVGIWTLVSIGIEYGTLDEQLRREFQKERIPVDAELIAMVKEQLMPYIYMFVAGGAALILMGVFVKQYPVPLTIAGLVVYVGIHLVFATLNPLTLVSGWIVKLIVIAVLWTAIQAAMAYEKERRMSAYNEF